MLSANTLTHFGFQVQQVQSPLRGESLRGLWIESNQSFHDRARGHQVLRKPEMPRCQQTQPLGRFGRRDAGHGQQQVQLPHTHLNLIQVLGPEPRQFFARRDIVRIALQPLDALLAAGERLME